MIRFVATYRLAVDDFETVDAFGDALMRSLTVNDDVLDPDVAISMTERTLEVFLLIDTDDGFDAIERGNGAIRAAFAGAGHPIPHARLFLHDELLAAGSAVRTELVSA